MSGTSSLEAISAVSSTASSNNAYYQQLLEQQQEQAQLEATQPSSNTLTSSTPSSPSVESLAQNDWHFTSQEAFKFVDNIVNVLVDQIKNSDAHIKEALQQIANAATGNQN